MVDQRDADSAIKLPLAHTLPPRKREKVRKEHESGTSPHNTHLGLPYTLLIHTYIHTYIEGAFSNVCMY
jgi:hypothetical protein